MKPYLIGLLLLCAGTQAVAENSPFRQGTEAFRAGDYETALGYFEHAQDAGNDSANLTYNLAVTLYRLERLDEARDAFEQLTDDVRWRDLARYNLGLIAQAQDDPTQAQSYFLAVARETSNERLQTLASERLEQLIAKSLAAPSAKAQASRQALLFSAGLAHDTNAANLADELSARRSGAGDSYLNALLYGHHYVSGEPRAGTRLFALAYARDFFEYDIFDTELVGAGFVHERPLGSLATEWGGRMTHARVDGAALINQYTASFSAHRHLTSSRLTGSAQASYFDAGDGYAHLQGWQQQLQLSWRLRPGNWTLTPSVRWQNNSRADRETESARLSYSPTVISVGLDTRWRLNDSWTLLGGYQWREATYSGETRLRDLRGVLRDERRHNTQQQLSLGARYRLSGRWHLEGEYQYTHADDNFDLYRYDKQLIGVKLEYSYE
ncbi:outer membrane beta-barrel protein [Marinimicrobium alkaliphilum]|uniref:outer membrane beta-barrel protein n=1 Tax=Marinimicrobium alkaliphilum TaxID=2202654 RepID=UPI000DBAC6EE|nr:outer membrane beta-barrel protein [Marinimicrobium alkaliphilum]